MPRALNDSSSALTAQNLIALPERFGCPVWAYDGDIISQRIKQLRNFDVIRFAQKACSNIHILRLMREQGVKVDSVSLGEIERALVAGFQPGQEPAEIVFTADLLDQATLMRVTELNIPVNAGSIDMLDQLGQQAPGHPVWLRINPGFGHGHSQKTNTGGENSKHGIWYQDLPQAIEKVTQYGLTLVGIHMHIGSGVDYQHLEQVCDAMVEQVISLGQDISAISAGEVCRSLTNSVVTRLIPSIITAYGTTLASVSQPIWAILSALKLNRAVFWWQNQACLLRKYEQ